MAFSPEFIEELKRVTSISRILGKFVTWDPKKTKAAKGDYWACCPFHSEKTPSFHATESRGTYYCFSCQEKGNAFTFLQKSQGMSFAEAVKFLAAEANLALPEPTGKEKEQAKKVNYLIKIHEIASGYYRDQLNSSIGKPSLDYLKSRGLKSSTIKDFGIGYAPNMPELITLLNNSGYSQEQIVEAGLAKHSDNGTGVYTTFRDRIIFPIQDSRGRVIAFGGRAMDPKVPAKYLNSPNTQIFSKGNILYNLHNASALVHEDNPLLVVEGYMDAIALHQAGFTASVAPLGTAVTAKHLTQLWRLFPLPIFAMDGDEAGIRAAQRIVDLALPFLSPGKSIRFCTLPQGLDPDELIIKRGVQGMRDCLNQSLEFCDFLWASETLGKRFDTLNARTILKDTLNGKIGQIENPVVRNLFKNDLNQRFFDNYIRRSSNKAGLKKLKPTGHLSRKVKESLTPDDKTTKDSEFYLLEALIVSLCLHYPEIIDDSIDEIETYDFLSDELNGIKSFILNYQELIATSPESLMNQLQGSEHSQEIEMLLDIRELNILPEISDRRMSTQAKSLFQATLVRLKNLRHQRNLIQEITDTDVNTYDNELLNLLKDVNLKRDDIETTILDQDSMIPDKENGDLNEDKKRLEEIISSLTTRSHNSDTTSILTPPKATEPAKENEMVMENSHRISKADYQELQNLIDK